MSYEKLDCTTSAPTGGRKKIFTGMNLIRSDLLRTKGPVRLLSVSSPFCPNPATFGYSRAQHLAVFGAKGV